MFRILLEKPIHQCIDSAIVLFNSVLFWLNSVVATFFQFMMSSCEIRHQAGKDHISSYFTWATSGWGLSWLLEHLEGLTDCPVSTLRLCIISGSISCSQLLQVQRIVLGSDSRHSKIPNVHLFYSYLCPVIV